MVNKVLCVQSCTILLTASSHWRRFIRVR